MEISKFADEQLVDQIAVGREATPEVDPMRLIEQVVHRARSGAGVDFDVFESLIGENDLVEINYLERGLMAARAVCRLNVPAPVGDSSEWGTGFLIGPRLLLTNNHVIGSPEDALKAAVEFGYELDAEGRLKRTSRFRLSPQDGFVTSPRDALDYTIVAIEENSEDGVTPISDFGFLRLDARTGKTEVGQYATIIQHPDAKTKRISLRENKFVKYGDDADPERDNFLWYSSDTANGSSGAAVFTDAWQVVCLHHAGVPDRQMIDGEEHWVLADKTTAPARVAINLPVDKVHWLANEGVRVSKLITHAEQQVAAPGFPRSTLIDDLIADATGVRPFAGTTPGESIVGPPLVAGPVLRLVAAEARRRPTRHTHPANYFDGREGYQSNFLPAEIPLPTLGANALRHGSPAKVTGEEDVQASVFSGPLFRSDDEEHRGILIPQFFWKVIAVTDKNNRLYTSGYMVSQQDYGLNIPFERLPVGPNSTKPGQNFQVPVAKIIEDTGIVFTDDVVNADVYSGPSTGRALRTVADIEHPRR